MITVLVRCHPLYARGTARNIERRRSYLALLHRSLVDQMTADGWLLMRAAQRADAIIDQVRAAIIDQADG